MSLRNKVLLVAAINVVLLAAALVWFAQTQLTQNFGALVFGESRARVVAVVRQLARELPVTDVKDRDALLARYSKTHGVTFSLFLAKGTGVAGPPLSLPDALKEHLRSEIDRSPLLRKLENAQQQGLGGAGPPPVSDANPLPELVDDAPFFVQAPSGYWVASRVLLRAHDEPGAQPGMVILMARSLFGTPFLFNLRPWLTICGLAVLIVLACWLPLARGATSTIRTLASATAKIAKGSFSEKVGIQRRDELGRLGESFNRMASQLEGYVHGQKRFLRDAAHELRSPLARMQAALGNILECKSELGPEVEPLLEDLREEIDLMSSLTGDLLTFAREENPQVIRKLAPVNLSQTAARVVKTENPSGEADVRVLVGPELNVSAHAESLFRGLSNVVRNAIRYAGHAGPIIVAAEQRDDATVVTVTDKGPGIPEEAHELVFTPFYRLDISRDRNTGGNGLGMAIARSCIETCQGTIYCRNANPGLEVTITLRNEA